MSVDWPTCIVDPPQELVAVEYRRRVREGSRLSVLRNVQDGQTGGELRVRRRDRRIGRGDGRMRIASREGQRQLRRQERGHLDLGPVGGSGAGVLGERIAAGLVDDLLHLGPPDVVNVRVHDQPVVEQLRLLADLVVPGAVGAVGLGIDGADARGEVSAYGPSPKTAYCLMWYGLCAW